MKKQREALNKAFALDMDDRSLKAKVLVMRAGLQDKPEKKLADFDEAVRLVPDDAATVRERGQALANLDKLQPALADLDKATKLDPNDGRTYEDKALVLARLKKYDQALAALEKARKLSPESVVPLVRRAQIHAQQQKLDAALEDLNQAHIMDPANVAVLLLRAAPAYQEKGNKRQALADVDKVLKINPDLPLAIRTRAVLLAEDNKLGRSRRRIGEAAETGSKRRLDVAATRHALHRPEEIY